MGCLYGIGTRDDVINSFSYSAKLRAAAATHLGYWEVPYAMSVNLTKAAICASTIRITNRANKVYHYILWGVLIAEIFITVTCLVALAILCQPPGAQWDPSLGKCLNYDVIPLLSYPFTAVNIITDWTCSIVPYLVLRKLQMPKRAKYSLMAVLCFGSIASVGSIVRAPYIPHYQMPEDRFCRFFAVPFARRVFTRLTVSCI